LSYVTAGWHILDLGKGTLEEESRAEFWSNLKKAITPNKPDSTPAVFTEKSKHEAVVKESMMKALMHEMDRLQQFVLYDQKDLTNDASIRASRLQQDKDQSHIVRTIVKNKDLDDAKIN